MHAILSPARMAPPGAISLGFKQVGSNYTSGVKRFRKKSMEPALAKIRLKLSV